MPETILKKKKIQKSIQFNFDEMTHPYYMSRAKDYIIIKF